MREFTVTSWGCWQVVDSSWEGRQDVAIFPRKFPRTNVSWFNLTRDIHSRYWNRQQGKYVYMITPMCIFGISNRDPHTRGIKSGGRKKKKKLVYQTSYFSACCSRALTTTRLLLNPEISMAQSPACDCYHGGQIHCRLLSWTILS